MGNSIMFLHVTTIKTRLTLNFQVIKIIRVGTVEILLLLVFNSLTIRLCWKN